MIKRFFLRLSKMGRFLPKFQIKKNGNSSNESQPNLAHVVSVAESQTNII